LPNFAQPGVSLALVHTESVPPTPLTGCITTGSLPAIHCYAGQDAAPI
jgi:hypothetical protein